jgi:2-haloalkanoic acid dehalogenase type II
LSEFRYLTFDCYGTLVDWRSGIEAALAKALGRKSGAGVSLADLYVRAEMDEEGTYTSYREVLARTAARVANGLGLRLTRVDASEFAASVPRWPAFGDTSRALRALGEMGFKRYILSNVDNDLLELTISEHGFDVDGFVTAEEVGSYKPSQGHWREFMKRTGARKEQILHVAQSVFHDIEPAEKMRLADAWINRYGQALPPDIHPLFISDDLAGLVRLLK